MLAKCQKHEPQRFTREFSARKFFFSFRTKGRVFEAGKGRDLVPPTGEVYWLVSAEPSQRHLLRTGASVVGKRNVTSARSRLGRSEGDLNLACGASGHCATVNARR